MTVIEGQSAEAFLGTQGYVWDTQTDMAFALIGAITALALLGKLHDRQLRILVVRLKSPVERKYARPIYR